MQSFLVPVLYLLPYAFIVSMLETQCWSSKKVTSHCLDLFCFPNKIKTSPKLHHQVEEIVESQSHLAWRGPFLSLMLYEHPKLWKGEGGSAISMWWPLCCKHSQQCWGFYVSVCGHSAFSHSSPLLQEEAWGQSLPATFRAVALATSPFIHPIIKCVVCKKATVLVLLSFLPPSYEKYAICVYFSFYLSLWRVWSLPQQPLEPSPSTPKSLSGLETQKLFGNSPPHGPGLPSYTQVSKNDFLAFKLRRSCCFHHHKGNQ